MKVPIWPQASEVAISKHHSWLCGRVFSTKCMENSVPAPSEEPRTTHEEWEKIRVCFILRLRLITAFRLLVLHRQQLSLLSTKSIGNAYSGVTLRRGPYSAEPYQSAQLKPGTVHFNLK